MGAKLYVANSGESTISVVDCAKMREVERLSLPPGAQGPRRLLLLPEGLFHSDALSATAGRLFGRKKERCELVSTGAGPAGLCRVPGGVALCCAESNSLWFLRKKPLRPLSCVQTGAFPIDVAGTGALAAVAELFTGRITFWNGKTAGPLWQFERDGMPLCVAGTGGFSGGWLAGYLQPDGSGRLWRFSRQEAPVLLRGCAFPASRIICLKGQKKAVAAHVWDDSLTLFDWERMEVLWHAAAGRMPDDLCAAEWGERIFVSCMLENAVRVFDGAGRLLSRIPVGKAPRGLALEEEGGC